LKNILDKHIIELQIAIDQKESSEIIKIIDKIQSLNDPECIKRLPLLLIDNYVYNEVFFSIIHTIEAFELNIYIKNIIEVLPELYLKCPDWTEIILYGIKNSNKGSILFKEYLNNNILLKSKIDQILKKLEIKI
jgi:hypothetical protein